MTVTISGTTGVSLVQDGTVTPAKTQVGATPSMVRLSTANGYGSTNTTIPRFSNIVTNQGSDITYTDSATLGASFTINVSGVYAVSFSGEFSAAANIGVSLNSTQLSTNIAAIVTADRLCLAASAGAGFAANCASINHLVVGAVIRAHTDVTTASGNVARSQFTIVRIA